MRGKPSRKCFLINQMIWPIGLATDKFYIVHHTRWITVFILRHHRKSKTIGLFTKVPQLLTDSENIISSLFDLM